MWQDTAVFVGTFLLSYGLAFQVYRNFKQKKCEVEAQTSCISAMGVMAICVSVATLGLLYSAIINGIVALLWVVLFIQRLVYKNRSR